MIIGLDHVQITIPKEAEEEGRRFYCGLLGLPEIEKPAELKGRGGFWLQVGDRQVHIGTEDRVGRFTTKAHVAYEVDDLEALRVELEAAGITINEAVAIPERDRFEIRDPFGNRVEFTQQWSPLTHPSPSRREGNNQNLD
jgi:catechol 2,3-dioxygenase-like lactoylglutathione lyase family enzyme